jgi:hypothetical protein
MDVASFHGFSIGKTDKTFNRHEPTTGATRRAPAKTAGLSKLLSKSLQIGDGATVSVVVNDRFHADQ